MTHDLARSPRRHFIGRQREDRVAQQPRAGWAGWAEQRSAKAPPARPSIGRLSQRSFVLATTALTSNWFSTMRFSRSATISSGSEHTTAISLDQPFAPSGRHPLRHASQQAAGRTRDETRGQRLPQLEYDQPALSWLARRSAGYGRARERQCLDQAGAECGRQWFGPEICGQDPQGSSRGDILVSSACTWIDDASGREWSGGSVDHREGGWIPQSR